MASASEPNRKLRVIRELVSQMEGAVLSEDGTTMQQDGSWYYVQLEGTTLNLTEFVPDWDRVHKFLQGDDDTEKR